MGLDGLFGEEEDEDYYNLDGLFHEPLKEEELSILDCNEQCTSVVTENEGNDLICQPILSGDTSAKHTKLTSTKKGKNCIMHIQKI